MLRCPSGVSRSGGAERRVRVSAGMWPFVARLWPKARVTPEAGPLLPCPAQPRGARVGGSPPPLCLRAPAQCRVRPGSAFCALKQRSRCCRLDARPPRCRCSERSPERGDPAAARPVPAAVSRERLSGQVGAVGRAGPAAAARCHPRTGDGSAPAPPASAFPRKPGSGAPGSAVLAASGLCWQPGRRPAPCAVGECGAGGLVAAPRGAQSYSSIPFF